MGMEFTVNSDLKCLEVESPECCGWLEVSNFLEGFGNTNNTKKDIEKLCKDAAIHVESDWSNVYGNDEAFTLFCVLIKKQKKVFHSFLSEQGWQALPAFFNPNTGNTCYPYMFIPKGYERIELT